MQLWSVFVTLQAIIAFGTQATWDNFVRLGTFLALRYSSNWYLLHIDDIVVSLQYILLRHVPLY